MSHPADVEIIQKVARKLGCPIAWHVGTPGCRKCRGTGFVPIPLWLKLKAHFIEGLPWNGIRKEIWCMVCEGKLVWEETAVNSDA